ncbi:ATPase, partial [Streptomyces sp. SID2119]|nr:ATPase [Streptomyces sp. SID2119]
SRLHLARALLARAEPGDTGRARALLGEVEREAGELGLHHLTSESPALPTLPPAAGHCVPDAAAVPPPAPAAAEFRRDGSVWQLRWDGRTVHVPDAKGLRDLHSLLGLPGADVPAVQLLAP